VTAQQRRQQLANALDAHRNAAALGDARRACLPAAAGRLASVRLGEHEFFVKGERPAAVRPYVRGGGS
jgi:hypothetical protein